MQDTSFQAWWSHRQGLDGSLQGCTPAEVLERTGWARSVGGVGPYLTFFARAGCTRAEPGDARAFSLDSPRSRGPRIQALRAAAAAR